MSFYSQQRSKNEQAASGIIKNEQGEPVAIITSRCRSKNVIGKVLSLGEPERAKGKGVAANGVALAIA